MSANLAQRVEVARDLFRRFMEHRQANGADARGLIVFLLADQETLSYEHLVPGDLPDDVEWNSSLRELKWANSARLQFSFIRADEQCSPRFHGCQYTFVACPRVHLWDLQPRLRAGKLLRMELLVHDVPGGSPIREVRHAE